MKHRNHMGHYVKEEIKILKNILKIINKTYSTCLFHRIKI